MDTERSLPESLTEGGAFLSENAESFGLVSDAHPVTTPTLMIAANGHAADDGMHPPTFAVSGKGVDGLFEGLYGSLIRRSDANEEILRMTFGESEGRQNHPIARYCAALTVALAHQTLTDMAGESAEACGRALSDILPDGIDGLRDVMRAAVGPRPGSEHFFSVSFCACRVTQGEQGVYAVDIFHAGDFALYVLDEQGLSPLLVCESDVLEPLDTSEVQVARLLLEHPEPMALLLLSKSLFDLSVKDFRAMQDTRGLLWRYRMRLEDQLVRLVTSSTRDELAERAERFFSGRAVGRDSASGAWMIPGGTYDALRAACRTRLHRLERIVSLLPKGYDPESPSKRIPLEQVERDFILSAFRTRPGLAERTVEAIAQCVQTRLRDGETELPVSTAEETPPRLTYSEVKRVFLSFDARNREDREQIQKNREVIGNLLSEHWTTLRPLLCRYPMADGVSEEMRERSESAAQTCIALKERIAYLVARRKRSLEDIRTGLQDALDVLERQSGDWISGVGGDGSAYEWFRETGERLPRAVAAAREEYSAVTDRLRGLQSAYTLERALSFDLDTSEGGPWYTCYHQILDGELPADIWRVYANQLAELATGYGDLWQVIRTVSERTQTLRERIESRAAERRTVQTLSGDEEWQVACVLGAIWEDTAWGERIGTLVDNGFRNEYKALRRRWLEERELLTRQRETFEEYRDMYDRYTGER